ncbi:MAG: hypothetical protein ACTSQZ_07220, partial [Candidatus Thorarchaeota archaeon]
MRKRVAQAIQSSKELIQVELAVSYSFILIIAIFGIISILTGVVIMNVANSPLFFNVDLELPFVGSEDMERYLEYFTARRGSALGLSFKAAVITFSFLMPMLIAFSLSSSFEDGMMKTLLSYPISRTQYLVTKSGILLTISFLFPLFSSIFWTFLWFPSGFGIPNFLLICISAFASLLIMISSLVLLSIVSRKVRATAIIGLSVWGILIFLTEFLPGFMPIELVKIINPLKITEYYIIEYLLEVTLFDVSGSIV